MELSWGNVICRGIIANWLVNLGVFQAFCARDVMGKAIGVWTPITCFVAIGFEHCELKSLSVKALPHFLSRDACMHGHGHWCCPL